MPVTHRRYDIDWLRVIAIGLLLVYHTAIAFQSWGIMLGFIVSSKSWESLWIPMSALNVWRIPLLFFVSGMGVYFAMQNKNWKNLLKDRTVRILVPFVVGIFLIVPIQIGIWQFYYKNAIKYYPHPSHLWFLGNIFVYVLIFLPLFFYLKKNEEGRLAFWIKKILSNPLSLLVVVAAFALEAWLGSPMFYELYALTWHGFFLGMFAFFFGFCFVLAGAPFWNMLVKWRWVFLGLAVSFYVYRLFQVQMKVPHVLLAIESNFWIFALFAFGYKHLNFSSKALVYLSGAAYPVYIIHMICLFLASFFVFPLDMAIPLKYAIVLTATFVSCFVFYEFLIRRVGLLRPLFGLKMEKAKNKKEETSPISL